MVEETATTDHEGQNKLMDRIALLETHVQVIEQEVHAFKRKESERSAIRVDTKVLGRLRDEIRNSDL